MSERPVITPHSVITAHLTISLEDGSVADTTRVGGKPARLVLGDESLSPAIEQALIGLELGAKHRFEVPPEQAYGFPNPDNVQYMDLADFPPDMRPEPGLIIAFAGINGQEQPGIIRDINGASVKVDFNHPLAGHTVTFEVEILGIA